MKHTYHMWHISYVTYDISSNDLIYRDRQAPFWKPFWGSFADHKCCYLCYICFLHLWVCYKLFKWIHKYEFIIYLFDTSWGSKTTSLPTICDTPSVEPWSKLVIPSECQPCLQLLVHWLRTNLFGCLGWSLFALWGVSFSNF